MAAISAIAVAGCVAQAEGNEIIRRAPVSMWWSARKAIIICALLARAKSHGRALETNPGRRQVRILAPPKPEAIARAAFILRSPCRKLRQVLHVLRVPYTPRRGSVAPGRKDRRRRLRLATTACAKSL